MQPVQRGDFRQPAEGQVFASKTFNDITHAQIAQFILLLNSNRRNHTETLREAIGYYNSDGALQTTTHDSTICSVALRQLILLFSDEKLNKTRLQPADFGSIMLTEAIDAIRQKCDCDVSKLERGEMEEIVTAHFKKYSDVFQK